MTKLDILQIIGGIMSIGSIVLGVRGVMNRKTIHDTTDLIFSVNQIVIGGFVLIVIILSLFGIIHGPDF
jgi:hypothetical protein